MSNANQKSKKILKTNVGMTLVELLVAISLLTLIIFCFMPLFMSYYKNIKTSGNIVSNNYTKVGLIEKLVGNTGSNSGYEYEVDGIPLVMSVKEKSGSTIQVKSSILGTETGKEYGQKINGSNIISTPDSAQSGFTTFYANSVTSTMLCFPTHISDDFKEKTITLFASGFKFNNINEITLQYTDEEGNPQPVDKKYYKVSQPISSPGIAYLTLYGDNEQINFRTSPLTIQYPGRNDLVVEIDAPTIVMVGEQTNDGKYYYYVASGDVNDDGTMDIVAKTMNNTDSNGKTVTLNSAMNDVEWVSTDGGDGKNVDENGNKYGYYAMCGDNGQIRRFWKDNSGKYYWGGDNTVHYDYSSVQPERENNDHASPVVTEYWQRNYSTEASYKYLFSAYPYAGENFYNGDRTDGICLDRNSLGKLYTNTAFTLNAVDNPNARFWAINSKLLYTFESPGSSAKFGTGGLPTVMYDRYTLNTGRAIWSAEGYDPLLLPFGDPVELVKGFDKNYFTVDRVNAKDVGSYENFWGGNSSNGIVLTSVDTVKMFNNYNERNGNPTESYMLYCGYIPAVVDLWSPTKELDTTTEEYMFSRWLATLGVGYVEDRADLLLHYNRFLDRGTSSKNTVKLAANIWQYSNSSNSSYALTGICGPENYSRSASLQKVFEQLKKQQENPQAYGIANVGRAYYPVYPLNGWHYQQEMQEQNTTEVSIGYLSNPRAMGGLSNNSSSYDYSPDIYAHANVYQWTFDRGTTFLDSDNITLEDDQGNQRSMSIAVGYTLSGLENGYNGGVVVPTVMNCGVVYLRSGGANNETWYSGGELSDESNIFHMFYYPSAYWNKKGSEALLERTVSAGYWRDYLHPLYYSTYGSKFVFGDQDLQYSWMGSHILFDKRLNCVAWGTKWDSQPEALWGASDGTVMNWGDITNSRYWDQKSTDYNAESVRCEFQSYNHLEKEEKDDKGRYWVNYRWGSSSVGSLQCPRSLSEAVLQATDARAYQGWDDKVSKNPSFQNAYLDCRSLILWEENGNYDPNAYGFISPLDTVEDVTYSDDIWVAVGCQGQKNPQYCGTMAVNRSSGSGSWVAVRTWFDLSNGADSQPCLAPNSKQNYSGSKTGKNNNFFLWHAVQISTVENCNIVQITSTGGMWYAVGYIDANDNNKCDSEEKAVVFYAQDPTKACGTEGGWTLAKSSVRGAASNHTQACHYNGSSWETVDIPSINAMASRND